MSRIAVIASSGTFLASLGAIVDAHSRLGEAFLSNPALGDYAKMQTQLTLVAAKGGDVSLAGGRSMAADLPISALDDVRMIYLPSFQVANTDQLEAIFKGAEPLHRLLVDQHSAGRPIGACGASVCHLAAAGLLDGKPAAVHPKLFTSFRRLFPKVQIDGFNTVVHSGNIMMCGPDFVDGALVQRMIAASLGSAIAHRLQFREPTVTLGPSPSLSADPLVTEAKLWIHERFTRPIQIGELAAILGVSHQTLLRRFRAAGEGTPRAFATNLRIEAAVSMLTETTRRIAEIAQLVGYNDIVTFREMFVRLKGVSPSEYRRKMRAIPATMNH